MNESKHSSRTVVEQACGFAGGVGGLAGASIGGLYGAPANAGALVLGVYIAIGAIVGGFGSGFGVMGLAALVGDRPVAAGYMILLIALLTLLGGAAGYALTGGRVDAVIGGAVLFLAMNTTIAIATRRLWLREKE